MKFKLSIDRMTGNRVDVTFEVERTSVQEQARWAAEHAESDAQAIAAAAIA
jgi:hypothetical protein